jgi:hypothetical protein
MPFLLEQAIEPALHLFPESIAIWLDDHAAADGGVFRETGILNDIEIPLGIVFGARSNDIGHERCPCAKRRSGGQMKSGRLWIRL